MPLELFRIDERLLHGQVVVGWGMRLGLGYYIVVDDEVAGSPWEQDLYAAGLPDGIRVFFVSAADAVARFTELDGLPGRGALITRGTRAMRKLAEADFLRDRRVNVGGLHGGEGRRRVADYVYLRREEAEDLRVIDASSRRVTARDLPVSTEIELRELLHGVE
jgi:PTS system mannose-specific IIB component/fructoselysine and glucoselysine-specific PTS system IIB component